MNEWMSIDEGHSINKTAQSAGAAEYTKCISVEPHPNQCPGYDTKQSYGEAPVMLEVWGMQSTSSLPLLLAPLWPGVVAPDSVLSMGQIKLFGI